MGDTESDEDHVSDSEGEQKQPEEAGASSAGNRKKPEAQKFNKGDIVKVHGLVKAAVHNGQSGVLGGWDKTTQRFFVTLENNTIIGVKEANLTLVPAAPAVQVQAPVLEFNEGGNKLVSELSGIVRSSGGNDQSTNTALTVAGSAVIAKANAAGTAVRSLGKRAAEVAVLAGRTHGSKVAKITVNGVFTGVSAFFGGVAAVAKYGAQSSKFAPPQIANSSAAPAGAAGAAAGGGGLYGFGRVPQAEPLVSVTYGKTYIDMAKIAQNHGDKYVAKHMIAAEVDEEVHVSHETFQQGGIAWAILPQSPNANPDTACHGIMVWDASNQDAHGNIKGVWVENPGVPKCPNGPNCYWFKQGECLANHALCWSFRGCCGKPGPQSTIQGHPICHQVNQHPSMCNSVGPFGTCKRAVWNPPPGAESGHHPHFCRECLTTWVQKRYTNTTYGCDDNQEPWGPGDHAFNHLSTAMGDAGRTLVQNGIKNSHPKKKTKDDALQEYKEQCDILLLDQ